MASCRAAAAAAAATRMAAVAMILLAVMAGLGEATVLFHNTGTTPSGWNGVNQEHLGTVTQVTNVVYKGSTAIKTVQIYDPSWTGRYHSEVQKDDVYSLGDTGFYGFAFRLQSDWEFDNQNYNVAQFIADFSDTHCDDYSPTSMVWINGNQLYTRVKHGTICPADHSGQITSTFATGATVSAGVWHTVVIQAAWKSDNTGFYKLWFDGAKVVERYNIPTTLDDPRPFQFRVGLYANSWHDDHTMVGSQGTRQVWFDQIGAGSTFADADPAQWN